MTLNVNKGIEKPSSINKDAIKRKTHIKSSSYYFDEIRKSNISVLSQAITLIESSLDEHKELANQIIEKCIPFSGDSIRVGITGVPGAGKSTFIEALGIHLIEENRKIAVLAIDPSSETTKGSILGDKTRMEQLSSKANVFIRPSPSTCSLGGVAKKTRETIILCEAAGFDTIFIETVGVGQSETMVNSMVDIFVLLMLAGAGDELQGIKRGIMEMADIITITKADGNNIQNVENAKINYQNAINLFPLKKSKWKTSVVSCSSLHNTDINEVWNNILQYIEHTKKNDFFNNKRAKQFKYRMYDFINETLNNNFYNDKKIQHELPEIEQLLLSKKISSFAAANKLLNLYFS